VVLCRELTKLHEEFWRGDLEGALAFLEVNPSRGEFTLVIGGANPEPAAWEESRVRAALAEKLRAGLPRSQAAREVAALSGWPRRDVYTLAGEMG